MLSRKSGIFYSDFGFDYSCLVIRKGVIIFHSKQQFPYYRGKHYRTYDLFYSE